MEEETPISPASDNKPETRSKLRFKAGVFLIITNFPFGLSAVALAGVLAAKTGHKAFWAIMGLAGYALSWVMLGMGVVLSGKEGPQYARELRKKWFGHGK